jgi:hypothetical protein
MHAATEKSGQVLPAVLLLLFTRSVCFVKGCPSLPARCSIQINKTSSSRSQSEVCLLREKRGALP